MLLLRLPSHCSFITRPTIGWHSAAPETTAMLLTLIAVAVTSFGLMFFTMAKVRICPVAAMPKQNKITVMMDVGRLGMNSKRHDETRPNDEQANNRMTRRPKRSDNQPRLGPAKVKPTQTMAT